MNIPKTIIDDCANILLIGVGGGFDVFAGLPFVYHYSKNFVLVNWAPSSYFHYREATTSESDYPVGSLKFGPKYTIGRHGVLATKTALEEICLKHHIDAILAVDGGVDSLMTGNEENAGTILEDFIMLAAIDALYYPSVLCCVGFGTETEEELDHYAVLKNMANLVASRAFIGSFSLTADMWEYEAYKKECERVWDGKRKSHVQTKVISAVEGKFGNDNIYSDIDSKVINPVDNVFISPLSSIYWFFDLKSVVKNNVVIPTIKRSNTFADAQILFRQIELEKQKKQALPL